MQEDAGVASDEGGIAATARTLLAEIAHESEYSIPLSLNPSDPLSQTLKWLAHRNLIRWCPYPEEFYIITPADEPNRGT